MLENLTNRLWDGLKRATRKVIGLSLIAGATIFGGMRSTNAALTYTQLTFEQSIDSEPAVSPDGNKIVYVSDKGDLNPEIYIMNRDGSNKNRLTFNSAWDESPIWSPDGQKIAFVSNRDGKIEIYIMNPDGSNQTRLTYSTGLPAAMDPSWSSTNKMAFSSRYGHMWPSPSNIYSLDLNTSELELLVSGGAYPSWSPDGTEFVYSQWADERGAYNVCKSDIYGNWQFLSDGIMPDWGYNNKIAFVLDREIYMMNPDGTEKQRLTFHNANDMSPSWFPNGSTIAFESNRNGNYDIWVISGIPEPSLLALLGLGAGLVGLLTYRKKEEQNQK